MSLCRIFHDVQTIMPCKLIKFTHVCHTPIQMYGQQYTCVEIYFLLCILYVHEIGRRIHITEDRMQTCTHDGKPRGKERHGRYNDFITIIPSMHLLQREKDERQGVKTIGYAHTIAPPTPIGKGSLESLHLWAVEIATTGDYTLHSFSQMRLVSGIDALEVKVLYHDFQSVSVYVS